MNDVLVIGSLNMDFVLNVDSTPLPGQTISANNFSLIPGGKGANQAYALGNLGVNVSMIGLVGNDEHGKKLIKNLKQANVNTKNIIKMKNINTGYAFITVDKNGENSIITVGGANQKLTTQIIDDNIHLIKKSKIVVMQLEIPLEVVLHTAKIAKSLGKIVIIDPAPAKKNLPDELFKYINIIKPNETELSTITGITLNNDTDIINAAKTIINKGVENVIVTLGEKGSILINDKTFKKFKAIKVDAIDTTAAGDAYTAGLIKTLIDNKSLEDAINFGHIVSSIVVTKKGAQSSLPTYEEVKTYMKEGLKIE